MSTRLPGVRQIELLQLIRDGKVVREVDRYRTVPEPGRRARDVSAQVATLGERGWVEDGEDGNPALTVAGEFDLSDAEVIAAAAALPAEARPRASVTRRRLGNHPVKGWGKRPDGRNVECWDCYRKAKADYEAGLSRYRPELVVWSTNEGGREAERDAQLALAKHVVEHHTGQARTTGTQH